MSEAMIQQAQKKYPEMTFIAGEGEEGLYHWLNGFADDFFKGFSESERSGIFEKIAARVRKDLFFDSTWHIDYKRLRVMAIKP
ncbi:hypothetical protein D3C78_1031270 [compost metagenome]